MRSLLACLAMVAMASTVNAAVMSTTTHGPASTSLDGSILSGDVISGLIATELAGDTGWHPANTDPFDQLAAFTDDGGMRATGLTGLLNDFPPSGQPAKRVQYDLPAPTNISEIQILSGNNGLDGRVFSTTVVSLSTNGGGSFAQLGYFQSDPSGTVNTGQIGSTLVAISDDSGGLLGNGVTNLIFEFYGVDNTLGEMRDPFDGLNPFTGADDGLNAPNTSPLILEIDVDGVVVPEPTTCVFVMTGFLAWMAIRRRR